MPVCIDGEIFSPWRKSAVANLAHVLVSIISLIIHNRDPFAWNTVFNASYVLMIWHHSHSLHTLRQHYHVAGEVGHWRSTVSAISCNTIFSEPNTFQIFIVLSSRGMSLRSGVREVRAQTVFLSTQHLRYSRGAISLTLHEADRLLAFRAQLDISLTAGRLSAGTRTNTSNVAE
jgi:hypothetical protein